MTENKKPNAPDIKMLMVSNVFFRTMTFEKKGDTSGRMHQHVYDHVNFLAQGSVEVDINGEKTVYTAPSYIYISRHHRHRFTALEDGTISVCIHAIRDDSGDIMSTDIIPAGAMTPQEFTRYLRQEHGQDWQRPKGNPYDSGTHEFPDQ